MMVKRHDSDNKTEDGEVCLLMKYETLLYFLSFLGKNTVLH